MTLDSLARDASGDRHLQGSATRIGFDPICGRGRGREITRETFGKARRNDMACAERWKTLFAAGPIERPFAGARGDRG
jgi:hypothetical protein